MKKLTIFTALLLIAQSMTGQVNKIDTLFYSTTLDEIKMVDVYFPPGYDENPNLYYPVIYYLHYYTGNQNSMSEMFSSLQNLTNNGTIDPVIMVCADNCPEPFGGSMYVNSIVWGDYETYMTEDLVTWIENSFRAIPDKDHRGLIGHSMGGYGAFRFGILHKDK
jgi:enterochelin esterase-like enzyme